MSVAMQLSKAIAEIRPQNMKETSLDHAAMLIASSLASAALGMNLQSARIIRDLAKDKGGKAEATIWFEGASRLPIVEAGRANAIASDAAASDDSDLRNMMHCGTPLVTTAMAVAEAEGKSGHEALEAIVLGYEAAGRINDVIPNFRKTNFHGSSVVIFGVVVAAGRLLGLSTSEMAHALALAASCASGLSKASDTSTAREHNAGQAVLNGINAAIEARKGYTAEQEIFEMPGGFFETFGGVPKGADSAEALLHGFGREWDIDTDMAIKLVPGGHPYHALAEATAEAVNKYNIDWRTIKKITYARPDSRYMTGPIHPKDLIDMAHSPAYFLAAGAVDGGVTWRHVTNEKILDPNIHRVIDLVEVGDPPDQDIDKYHLGAKVEVFTAAGDCRTVIVYAPRGSTHRGITWQVIEEKFLALMPHSGLKIDRIRGVYSAIRNLREAADISPLAALVA